MKLLYELHKRQKPDFSNFGDELNLWIWPKLIPELLDENDSRLFVGIGTVLDENLPAQPLKVVFGTGSGYGRPPVIDDRFRIYCVRGPLTADALTLPCKLALTDPAVLISKLIAKRSAPRNGIVLMGHYTSALHADWSFACEELGLTYIHPLWPIERVLENILGAELVVTESMHGAIVADALRVPWIPVITNVSQCWFKWTDWTKSVGLAYRPLCLPALWDRAKPPDSRMAQLRRWVKRREMLRRLAPAKLRSCAQLSSEGVMKERTNRLIEKLDVLKNDAAREGWGRHGRIDERSSANDKGDRSEKSGWVGTLN